MKPYSLHAKETIKNDYRHIFSMEQSRETAIKMARLQKELQGIFRFNHKNFTDISYKFKPTMSRDSIWRHGTVENSKVSESH